jgi:hypothetical protein
MRNGKGWLRAQMRNAKQEMGDWRGWKRDTIRKEISTRLSTRGEATAVRSTGTQRLIIKERK